MTSKVGTVETPEEIATHILTILSASAYTSFSHALRELVVNAYDADAAAVTIRVADDYHSLSIVDTGTGMNREEFRTRYARIATPKALTLGKSTKRFKRPVVGMFGIGHLAIAPTCASARVITRKNKEGKTFEAILDYDTYLDLSNLSRPLSEVYKYYVNEFASRAIEEREWTQAERGESYTIVELQGLKQGIVDELKRQGVSLSDRFASARELSGISQLRFDLGVILPVAYVAGGPIRDYDDKVLSRIKRDVESYQFKVQFQGEPVLKPVLLPSFSAKFHEKPRRGLNYEVFTFNEHLSTHGIKFHGYLFNQSSQIVPRELRGVAIRLKNVAIGRYRPDFLGAHISSSPFRDSTSGEIYIDEGLEDAITLDRANFKEGHPGVRAVRAWLEAYLTGVLKNYHARGGKRKERRASEKGEAFETKLVLGISRQFTGPEAARTFAMKKGPVAAGRPVMVDPHTGAIKLNRNHQVFRVAGLRAGERKILEVCLYAMEIAKIRAGSDVERFYSEIHSIIQELLDEVYAT